MDEDVSVHFDASKTKYRFSTATSCEFIDTSRYQLVMNIAGASFMFNCCLSPKLSVADEDDTVNSTTSLNEGQPCRVGNREDPRLHIPHPCNKWILYRQYKSRETLTSNPRKNASEICRYWPRYLLELLLTTLATMVSDIWRREPSDVKAYWEGIAAEESRRHGDKYPDYSYAPIKKRKRQEGSPPPVRDTTPTAVRSRCQTRPAWDVNFDSAGQSCLGSLSHGSNLPGTTVVHSQIDGHRMATPGTDGFHGSHSMSSVLRRPPHTDWHQGANHAFCGDTPPRTILSQPQPLTDIANFD
jgi:hypothetical protein